VSEREGQKPDEVRAVRDALAREAEASGYHLNPDAARTERIVRGLLANEARLGYRSCPCRLAIGDRAADRDIICPCDYRDADLDEWGSCYCGLYASDDVLAGKRQLRPVPERRQAREAGPVPGAAGPKGVKGDGVTVGGGDAPPRRSPQVPAWRCRVCGYLCARDAPPAVCPICKATRDRFERYL
jgi:ferredoxin-thioredoxin reductase catalytic subunit